MEVEYQSIEAKVVVIKDRAPTHGVVLGEIPDGCMEGWEVPVQIFPAQCCAGVLDES